MNAQELFLKGGQPAGVYYCGKCHIVHREHVDAEQCCKPHVCECGAECPRHRLSCDACQRRKRYEREAAAFARVPKRTPLNEYTEHFVYVDNSDDYVTVDELLDLIDEDEAPGVPWHVYACIGERPQIDVSGAIDSALEDAYEDSVRDIPATAIAELTAHVKAWCDANMPVVYHHDPKHALIVPPPNPEPPE